MGGFEPQNYQCDGWQGKVYKINGSEPGYPNLKDSTGYPDDILGLGGVNCRHRMFPFWVGISTPNPIKYDEEENKRIYEARQHQRKLERDMRLLKKKKACADVIGDTETSKMLEMKIQAKSNEINNWCKANNLKRDYSRELVSEQITKNNQKSVGENGGKRIKTVTAENTVDLKYINSKEYRNKFNKISDNPDLNSAIYQKAKATLTFTNKTYKEQLTVFDENANMVLELKPCNKDNCVEYSKEDNEIIKAQPEYTLVSLHNHATNNLPTGADYQSAGFRKYKFGVVVTHNGRVFKYKAGNKNFLASSFDKTVEKLLQNEYNTNYEEALKKTTDLYIKNYGIYFEEMI